MCSSQPQPEITYNNFRHEGFGLQMLGHAHSPLLPQNFSQISLRSQEAQNYVLLLESKF